MAPAPHGPLHPALGTLTSLKLRGRARIVLRRLRTPRGWVFGGLGVLLFGLWVFALVLRLRDGRAGPRDPEDVRAIARIAVFAYAFFAITANLSWRGLYLPRAELERLFAAPVRRVQLVRYRLLGTLLPTSFVAVLVGIITAARVPSPWAGFCGGALVVWTTTVLGQGAALLAARPGGRFARFVERMPGGGPRIVGALGLAAVLLMMMFAGELVPTPRDGARGGIDGGWGVEQPRVVRGDGTVVLEGSRGLGGAVDFRPPGAEFAPRIVEFAGTLPVRILTAPTLPFAAAVAAPTFSAAVPWLALLLLLFALSFEGVARLPVDFREASLSTSQDVEKRLARMRRGQVGAAAGKVRKGWRVPRWFGRGPLATVAWVKTMALLRQGRGALAVGTVMAGVGTFVGITVLPPSGPGTVALALLGVAYLSSGLRFDFRADLDRLEAMRAWPLAPWQVFLGGVLPVTLFVAAFVSAMLVARAVAVGRFDLEVVSIAAATPLVSLLWIALDNALFLLFPVRFVPGQGGALQHSGRALVMVALRLVLLGVVGGVAGLAAIASIWVGAFFEAGPALLFGVAVSSALLVLIGAVVTLVAFGGWCLGRFDPARARLV